MTDDNGFPPKIGKPAQRALHGAGYYELAQLRDVTEAELKALHGMGPKALELLHAALHEKGWSFTSPPDQQKTSEQ
jgi:hypothetical protein